MTEKLTLNVTEFAQRMGLSRNAAYAAIHRGDIRCIKIGKRLLIPIVAMEKLLNEGGKVIR